VNALTAAALKKGPVTVTVGDHLERAEVGRGGLVVARFLPVPRDADRQPAGRSGSSSAWTDRGLKIGARAAETGGVGHSLRVPRRDPALSKT
jgi:hypothetical protein